MERKSTLQTQTLPQPRATNTDDSHVVHAAWEYQTLSVSIAPPAAYRCAPSNQRTMHSDLPNDPGKMDLAALAHRSRADLHLAIVGKNGQEATGFVRDERRVSMMRDRKSTRLNSSHVSISYA